MSEAFSRQLQSLLLRFERAAELSVRCEVSSRQLSTFGIGGTAARLIEVGTLGALTELLGVLEETRTEFRLLGSGSNLVFPDGSFPLPVLSLAKGLGAAMPLQDGLSDFRDLRALLARSPLTASPVFSVNTTRILAFAASPLMGLSRRLSQAGLSGLEFAAGIPGTIGGAVRMNAGAHGQAMQQILSQIFYLTPDGREHVVLGKDLTFRYRGSSLPDDALVIAAVLELCPGDPCAISEHRQSCLDYRRKTQPLQLPSAGSVFRNPERDGESLPAAGALLDAAGMKGKTRGGVRFSELHANWLVRSTETASAYDVRALVAEGQEAVYSKFGISLEPEIVFW